MEMKVIGIDPAPKKPTTVYDAHDGGWSTVEASDLPAYIVNCSEAEDGVLICWDAPLTTGNAAATGGYYARLIERFFQTQQNYTAPKGISVLAYAGCPHWAVTRAAIGLPRVGMFDCLPDKLPFHLCAEGDRPSDMSGKYIVEVHPAVAIWLWCQGNNPQGDWQYKRQAAHRENLWAYMEHILAPYAPARPPKNDDEFDAYVAYLLGSKWLADGDVILLGNAEVGSFLVPNDDGIQEALNGYVVVARR